MPRANGTPSWCVGRPLAGECAGPVSAGTLVWGQSTRVGRNLHFGFGHYRIDELGPDPTACRRLSTLNASIGAEPY